MNKDTSGPAFPHHFTQDSVGDCTGMSLRDYFAAKAMQGVLACPVQLASDQHMTARDAYTVADAMLEARSK